MAAAAVAGVVRSAPGLLLLAQQTLQAAATAAEGAASLPPQGASQQPRAPRMSPSRPTSSCASPGSASPGERQKPPGTWAARGGRARSDREGGETLDAGNGNGNTQYTDTTNGNRPESNGKGKEDDTFILPDLSNKTPLLTLNNTAKEHEVFIPLNTEMSNNTKKHAPKNTL